MPMLTAVGTSVAHGGVDFARGANEDQQHAVQKPMMVSMDKLRLARVDANCHTRSSVLYFVATLSKPPFMRFLESQCNLLGILSSGINPFDVKTKTE